jgi:hypothetical protein
MKEENAVRPFLLKVGLIFGIWTLVGLFLASQAYFQQAYIHRNFNVQGMTWWQVLRLALAEAYVHGLLTLVVSYLAESFPFEVGRWPGLLLLHLAASAGFALLAVWIAVPLHRFLDPRSDTLSFRELFAGLFQLKFGTEVFIYWLILGVCQALDTYRKYRDRELKATQLEARLAQARLQVLKMQLHPHFLFNTLHAISALMHQDVELADRMLARLGELLRATLDNAGTQEVSLEQELGFIQPYLEIEQARLGPRLSVEMDIDPETLDARVPNLLLQPLVENAIRHGIAPRCGPGRIEIRAHREQAMLHLQVRDDGLGLGGPKPVGVGVANTRARLRQLYGVRQQFDIRNGEDGGVVVTVAIPFLCGATDGKENRNGKPSGVDRG